MGVVSARWFEVRPVQETDATTFPVTLHRRERQAILLAEALRVNMLLIDEKIGRAIARSCNPPFSGTLGVLERADTTGLVNDFPQVIQRLKASGFFINQTLEQLLLDRHRRRREIRGLDQQTREGTE